jgi:hypothetical protein
VSGPLVFGPPRPRPWQGLRDGGHVVLRCSDCDRPLADVHVTRPQDDKVWRVRARCCYGCTRADGSPQTSFIEEVRGRTFHVGGFGLPNPDDPDDSLMQTAHVADHMETDSGGNPVVTIEVKQWTHPSS